MTWQSIILYTSLMLLLFYIMTCAGYLLLHGYFIIFPSRRLSSTPSDYQLSYEEVFFNTEDNVILQGWFIKGGLKRELMDFTIILFPGNKGTISDFLEQIQHLANAGFNVFLFGYRGFGKSQKKWPTEEGVYKDSKAACEYLLRKKNIPEKKIIFLGQSLGCAMASHTALSFDPHALILEGGFPSLAEVASRAVRYLPLKFLTRSRFETRDFLRKISCPVLIIHSREDNAIPLSDADQLYDAVAGKKKIAVISGPHAKGLKYDTEKYLMETGEFMDWISKDN